MSHRQFAGRLRGACASREADLALIKVMTAYFPGQTAISLHDSVSDKTRIFVLQFPSI